MHPPSTQSPGPPRRTGIDLPTLAVAATIYAAWIALTAWHAHVPPPLLALAGGAVVAWQGSLQHETIHGHPTRHAWLNALIGFPPLTLYLPYATYRRTHLAHHRCDATTHPHDDPESRYHRGAGLARLTAPLQRTLAGQLTIGPVVVAGRFLATELARAVATPAAFLREWIPHLAGVAVLVAWLGHVGLSIGGYLAMFVYPGLALTLLRGYAEHRAGAGTTAHAASVERAGAFALLFLNNNLHVAHHERPGLPWYRLPGYHRRHRARFAAEGGAIYDGYGEVVRRFAFRAHDDLHHPAFRPPPA